MIKCPLSLGRFRKSPEAVLSINLPRLRRHLITNIPESHGITLQNKMLEKDELSILSSHQSKFENLTNFCSLLEQSSSRGCRCSTGLGNN